MRPPRFAYVAPSGIDEVLGVLARAPAEISLLAGGQSLIPLLNMRLATPELVVDLGNVGELATITTTDAGTVRIGAMVRQRRVETDPVIAEHLPLLAEAVRNVGHPATRTRGTIGGSLCHADPSAELPCAVTALGGRMVLRGAGAQQRTVAAHDFFLGPMTTAVQAGELLVAIEIDPPAAGTGCAFAETSRTHRGPAFASAAALVELDNAGRVVTASLCVSGATPAPYAVPWIGEALGATAPDEPALAAVQARLAGDLGADATDDDAATYRRGLAGVMARRVLATAAARATRGADDA